MSMDGAKIKDIVNAEREGNILSLPTPTVSGQNISSVSTFAWQISTDLSWDAHINPHVTY